MNQKSNRVLILFLAALVVAGAASAGSDLWLHVRVNEKDGAKVTVNLPMTMIEKVLPMIPEDHMHEGKVVLDDVHISTVELRELWQELRDSPDMTFVTVEEDDERVRVWKENEYLYVSVVEEGDEFEESSGEKVDVRLPVAVVDALFSSDEQELDVHAAIRASAEHGSGELVTVSSDDEDVRVWVDNIAEAE